MACDQYWNSVSALLHFDGSDGSTTFTDETGKTWTASGNAQIDTAQSVFGGASGLFDGTGDCIYSADSADFNLGSAAWTIEARIRLSSVSGDYGLFGQQDDASAADSSITLRYSSSNGGMRAALYSGSTATTHNFSWSPSIDTWYAIALVRNGNTVSLYVDGVKTGSDLAYSSTLNDSTEPFAIGAINDAASFSFNGWLDEFRLTKGQARYTANYTPDASAFEAVQCVDMEGDIAAAAAADAALSVGKDFAGDIAAAAAAAAAAWGMDGGIAATADAAADPSVGKMLAGGIAAAADVAMLDAITPEAQSLARATAAIQISVQSSGTPTADIEIEVGQSSGTASADINIAVRDAGTASAPVSVAVVDSFDVQGWTVAASIGGVDVSSLLTGQLEVRMEEGASRTASFSLDVESTPLNPLSYVGQSVAIDLVRVVGGVSVTSPLFRGVVEYPSYQPRAATLSVECSQDLQHIVAALDRTSIDSLTGGGYHRAVHGDIDDNWDYAQACMSTQAASLDCGVLGNPRKTAWDGLALWRTFGTADIDEPDIEVTFPRRADLVNQVNCTFEYRYFRLRERHHWMDWSATWFDAYKHGAQYPTVEDIQAAVGGTGWQIVSGIYFGLPARVPYADGYVEIPSTSVGRAQLHVAQRHSQTVTETHTLTVQAPKSIDNSGTIAHEMRGTLASEWKADAWESDIRTPLYGVDESEETPPTGGFEDGYRGESAYASSSASADGSFSELPNSYSGGNLETDWAPDAPRSDAEAGIESLLNMARAKILGSHRLARVSAQTDILPELDVDRAVAIDIGLVEAQGKVAAVSHVLDIESGSAATRFSVAVSGIGAAGLVSETPIAPPVVDTEALLFAAVGEDDYTPPAYGTFRAGETLYSDSLMGWLINPPQSITIVDVPVEGGGTTTKTVVNPWYTSSGYPVTGFRAQMPGVDDARRNPADTEVDQTYLVQVPEDTFVI